MAPKEVLHGEYKRFPYYSLKWFLSFKLTITHLSCIWSSTKIPALSINFLLVKFFFKILESITIMIHGIYSVFHECMKIARTWKIFYHHTVIFNINVLLIWLYATFSHLFQLSFFHWSLSDGKFPQASLNLNILDGCNQSFSALLYVVFGSLYRWVNAVFSAGKSSSSSFSWCI